MVTQMCPVSGDWYAVFADEGSGEPVVVPVAVWGLTNSSFPDVVGIVTNDVQAAPPGRKVRMVVAETYPSFLGYIARNGRIDAELAAAVEGEFSSAAEAYMQRQSNPGDGGPGGGPLKGSPASQAK